MRGAGRGGVKTVTGSSGGRRERWPTDGVQEVEKWQYSLMEERDGGPLEKGQHQGMQPCHHLAKCLSLFLSEVSTRRLSLYLTSEQCYLWMHTWYGLN